MGMRSWQRITVADFLKLFDRVFFQLHRAVTGSDIVARLGPLLIGRVEVSERKSCNFWYVSAERETHQYLFSDYVPADHYAQFVYTGDSDDPLTTIHVSTAKGASLVFVCRFGYHVRQDNLVEMIGALPMPLKRSALAVAIQLAGHEIRHEIQQFHGLERSSYRNEFPPSGEYVRTRGMDWGILREFHEGLIEGYAESETCGDFERERDAVITSHLAMIAWHGALSRQYQKRMAAVADVIRG